MDELHARHRREQKELQGKLTSKKKNATKKTRKGVNDECDRLEQELKERQQAEISVLTNAELEGSAQDLDSGTQHEVADDGTSTEKHASDQAGEIVASDATCLGQPSDGNNTSNISEGKPRKQSRQKARLARRAAEQEAQIEAAAHEAANMPDQRQQELSAMNKEMENRGLTEILIRPDGHCLYSACSETIVANHIKNYKEVRVAAADYIDKHGDDFAPFLDEPLETYTHKIKNTAEWGGHLELQAIAKAFNIIINVLQANGHVEKIEPGSTPEQEIWLAYYMHSFGLGEHYNALKKVATG